MEKTTLPELYKKLTDTTVKRHVFSLPDLIVRLRDGIREPHAKIVMTLYWYHVFRTDRPMYDRLKACPDENAMRMALCGKVQTAYQRGEKTMVICSDLFPREFLEILDAYIQFTDELSRQGEAAAAKAE